MSSENKQKEKISVNGEHEEEDEEMEVLKEKKRAQAAAEFEKKKNEQKRVASTFVLFNVKVIDEQEDLDALANKIFDEINPDGLVWNKQYSLVPVAYGVKMLQIGMVIEDEKVQETDDIFDQILQWDESVQSVDIETMQKF